MWLHTMGLMATLALGFLVLPFTAEAQQAMHVYRVGWLSAGPSPCAHGPNAGLPAGSARPGLCRGAEPRHDVPLWRGKAERLREVAAELAQLQVDVIVAVGASGTRGAQHATHDPDRDDGQL